MFEPKSWDESNTLETKQPFRVKSTTFFRIYETKPPQQGHICYHSISGQEENYQKQENKRYEKNSTHKQNKHRTVGEAVVYHQNEQTRLDTRKSKQGRRH
jgi:hypothetical protein